MKKLYLLCLILFIALVGCSENEGDNASAQDNEENIEKPRSDETQSESETETEEDVGESEDQDGLTEIGQIIEEQDFSVELLKFKEINGTLEQGPFTLEIIDAKLIRMFDIGSQMQRVLQDYSNETIDDEVVYVQLQLKGKNNSEEDITWDQINDVVVDENKQVDGNNDILDQEFIYDVYAGVEVDYLKGYIVNDDTEHLRLIFSPVYEYDSFDELSPRFEFEFSFGD